MSDGTGQRGFDGRKRGGDALAAAAATDALAALGAPTAARATEAEGEDGEASGATAAIVVDDEALASASGAGPGARLVLSSASQPAVSATRTDAATMRPKNKAAPYQLATFACRVRAMRSIRSSVPVWLVACVATACADAGPPPAAPGAPIDPPRPNADLEMMMGDAKTPSAPPDAEAEKKAEAARKLAEDFAKLEKEQATEKTRWNETLRKQVADLSNKDFKSFKAALQDVVKSPHRTPGASERDKDRHPVETLTFFGLKQDMSVLELDAGGGWYTELLAPVLKKKGKLTVAGPNPEGPMTERSTLYGKRLRGFLDKAPELGDKVDYITIDPTAGFVLPADRKGAFDAVLAFRALHNWQRRNVLDKNLTAVFEALKPGGVFAVEAHRAKPGADPKASAEKGYLPEAYVIERVQAAGFKLDGKSEINKNAKDTTDYPEGVWTLPPTLRLGDKDKDKYVAIGESDRMTLKFVKPKK